MILSKGEHIEIKRFPKQMEKFLFTVLLSFLIVNIGWGQLRTASVSGNWSNTATWGGASVPTSANDVVINNGVNVTIDVATAECDSLTINGGLNTSSVLVGANNLNVTNAITINAPTAAVNKYIEVGNGSLSCASVTMVASTDNAWDSYISIIGSGSVNVSGNLTMNGSNLRNYIHFSGTGSLNIGGAFGGTNGGGITSNIDGAATAPTSGMVNFNGAGAQTIPAFNGYYNLTASNSGTKSLAAATTVNRNLSVLGSAVLNCRQFNITGNAAGILTMDAGTELIIGDPTVATGNAFPSKYTNANINLNTASTVTYSANAAQNVSGTPTYGNLNLSTGNTASTKTLAAATVINGNLNLTGGTAVVTLQLGANNITVNGTTNINANATLNDNDTTGANIFAGLVTISNTGTFSNTNNPSYEFRGGIANDGTFTKSGTGTLTFSTNAQNISGSSALTISAGDFIIADPASLNVSNSINFSGGNFVNNSNTEPAFAATSGTFTFVPNAAQNINGTGTGSVSFYNLSFTGGNTKTTNIDFSVLNNLTVTTAALSFGTTAKTINVGGDLSGNGTINMTGAGLAHVLNLGGANNAIATFNTTAGSGSTVNYNRAGDQQVFASPNYQNLTVSGGGIKTMQGNVTVNNILNLDNGILALGASGNLYIANGANIVGSFDNNHMIQCNGPGFLYRYANVATDFVMVYPVGTGIYYTPMEITSLSATVAAGASVSVRAVAGLAANTNPTDLNKYWEINSGGITSINANVSFTYNDPGEVLGDQTKYAIRRSGGIPATTWLTPNGPSPDGANPLSSIGTTALYGTWTARENVKTLYSYQTGNWNSASTWTTDPSGTLWTGASVPTASDRVVILNGRTVNVTNNGNTVYSLTVNNGGIIDLGSTTGHNFGSISGQGLIRLSVAAMPGGTYDNFVSAGGGTIEYYNTTSFTFSQLTYNNLILNLNTSALVATLTGNMTINGNLTITQGRLQINDATATSRNLTIYGDVYVASNGSVRIGTGNARHRITIKGDFTNDGSVRFTNQATPNYTVYRRNGYADVVFSNDSKDQNLLCNGQSDFYRIEIDKGIDQTYILNIDASATGNFALYGRNNLQYYWPENIGETAGSLTNDNALGLLAGTVRIGSNVTIPCLATDNGDYGVYTIDLDAGLWIDNGSVVYNSASQWRGPIVYGSLKISGSGVFDGANAQNGLVLKGTGLIDMQGGSMTFPVIRVSSRDELATQRGAYKQSGGTVTITGNTGIGNMASFTLPYAGMGFMMSGGTLNILSSTSAAGNGRKFSLIIAADPNNVSVTGGTVNITVPGGEGRAAYINSSAPFYNLNITSTNNNNAQLQTFNG